MKVLWLSDGGCTTGFGRVTHSIGERLVRDYGHEVEVLAINHSGDYFPSALDPGKPTPLKLFRPERYKGDDTYGNSRVLEMLGRGPDVVVMLNDPHQIISQLYSNPFDPRADLLLINSDEGQPVGKRPILSYVPCDGYDLPPQWTDLLPKSTTVAAMSKFGQAQYEGSTLVYHGVDPDTFWPVQEKPIKVSTGETLKSKRDCKRAFGLDPDGFLILRVDSNSGRKDYGALIKALVPVLRRHGDVQAWFHCQTTGEGATNLPLAMSKHPDVVDRVFYPGLRSSFTGWPDSDMNALFSAADLFVSTSRGEGFGLTLAEAAMARLPVVAQNVSAIPEVVGPGARLLEPAMRLTVPSGEDVCLADTQAFTDAIEELYQSAGARRDLGEAGREHVLKSFDWDVATKKFDGLIQGLVQ